MPSWNGKDYTIACLDSIASQDYPLSSLEVIISDNGSTDGSIEAVKEKFTVMNKYGFHNLILLENGQNFGAPAAYNLCIPHLDSQCQYVLKIDNDTLIGNGAIFELIKAFDWQPDIGVVGAKMVSYDDTTVIAHSSGFLSRSNMRLSQGDADTKTICDFVNGAGMMISAKLFFDQNMRFCEDFFIYYDDTDLCLAARQLGLKTIYWPDAQIRHKVSASSGSKLRNPTVCYYMTRGYIQCLLKYGSQRQRLLGFLSLFLFFNPKAVVGSIIDKRLDAAGAIYLGSIHALVGKTGRWK